MKTINTTLTTTALYSNDGKKRYLLQKIWDESKPRLTIVMLAPSEASGIELDNTTMLVLNNASRLGYGSVNIVNLFASLGYLRLNRVEDIDQENLTHIDSAAKEADTIIYAAGVGKATNKAFIKRQSEVLKVLTPYETKLRCLSNGQGNARFQHPLSPAVRTWHLSEMKVFELCTDDTLALPTEETKKRERKAKK